MAEWRSQGMLAKVAVLCAAAGVLLVGIGLWQHHPREEQWQPLNEQLYAALNAAEQQHTVVDSGKPLFMELEQPEPDLAVNGTKAVHNDAESGGGARRQANSNIPDSGSGAVNIAEDGLSGQPNADSSLSDVQRLNINTATVSQLDELPGIGPAKAAAIVADRESAGPFRSVDDLARVKGIGPAIVAKLRDSVVALP